MPPKPVLTGRAEALGEGQKGLDEPAAAGRAVTTPTSPAVLAAADKRIETSDGATVTEDDDNGGRVEANGAAGDAAGGGVTSRGPRLERPPGWPQPLPWPLTDPPPACIRLPGPRGMLTYTLAPGQVRTL